jgi:3-methyladenine DNA glycosylase/8-oxoguanine DNA glycosylase
MSTARFVLTPRGEFSLAESVRFLHGFEPLSDREGGDDPGDTLRLAFCTEGDWRPVAVQARQSRAGRVTATVAGTDDPELARRQVERMLSLDVDATALPEVLRDDGVASALVEQSRGLRPVCFASPYEAACWAVLSQRIRMSQAARIRRRLCDELGHVVEIDDLSLSTFPRPEALLAASALPGLPQFKVKRLQAIAGAALDGRLDAATLRAAGPEQALADLQRLPGIGPFGAELALVRGAGEPDHFARSERRLHAAMAEAYGVAAVDVEALAEIASRWSPFRSWIGFLFRARAARVAA